MPRVFVHAGILRLPGGGVAAMAGMPHGMAGVRSYMAGPLLAVPVIMTGGQPVTPPATAHDRHTGWLRQAVETVCRT